MLAASVLAGSVLLGAGVSSGSTLPGPTRAAAAPMSEMHAPMVPATSPGGDVVGQPQVASNWSGYAVTGRGFTAVTGHWRVPQVTGPLRGGARFSASWVGIDGDTDGDLIQAGTEQDWIDGGAFYQAWWEILPEDESPIPSIAVHPGDAMTVSITKAAPKWVITVTDATTGQSFTTTQYYFGPGTSAEWIQERPEVGDGLAALADYGTVTFDQGTVDGVDPDFTTSDEIVMVKGGRRISTPSAPDSTADGFAVAYGAAAPPVPIS